MSDRQFRVRSQAREYEVVFVDDLASAVSAMPTVNRTVIIDQAVTELHGSRLGSLMEFNGVITLHAEEQNKTLDGCQRLIVKLVENGFRKNDQIVAIGGGIIQDIAAFSASILYRGVEWLFIPTTLLAQADSCIGSKTSINLGDKKNLVGNFYPPSRILIDLKFLDTLSVADVRSGIGEMLHFFFYADSPMTMQLMAEYDRLIEDRKRLEPYIHESLRIKRAVAEADEFDRGERNKFNYGHTFGHALESVTGYSIPHGLAVTVGMDLANYISLHQRRMALGEFNAMHAILRRNFPDADLSTIDLEPYVGALSKDKKNLGGDLVCILASRPGSLEKVRLAMDDRLRQVIARYFHGSVWRQESVSEILTNA